MSPDISVGLEKRYGLPRGEVGVRRAAVPLNVWKHSGNLPHQGACRFAPSP
jgi:hypothetical protein